MINWEEFFIQHRISYVTQGPNTPRGEISIKCPYCGDADPSEHLCINPQGAGWRCLRDKSHRGKSPIRLIQKLTNCSYDQARVIAGLQTTVPSDFLDQVKQQMQVPEVSTSVVHRTTLPENFKTLRYTPSCKPFLRYLQTRGFKDPEVLSKPPYDLRYTTTGPWHGRIIFPCIFEGQVISWTGRTIRDSDLRYKTLTTKQNDDGVIAQAPIGHYLLWWDDLITGGDTIVLTEGPFDALKVDLLGKTFGIRATCFFTNTPSAPQLDLLHQLLPKYKKRILLLDREATTVALKLQSNLTSLAVVSKTLPPSYKDPGEIESSHQLISILGLD